MSKKTIGLIVGLLAVTVVLLVVALTSRQADRQATDVTQGPTPTPVAQTVLSLSPETVELAANGTGSVDVFIDTGENEVTGVQLEVSYDPAIIRNVAATPADFLQNPIAPDRATVNSNNEPGHFTFFLGTLAEGTKGTGKVATITFSKVPTAPRDVTETGIEILPETLVTAKGVFNTSVLLSATGATVRLTPSTSTGATTPVVTTAPAATTVTTAPTQ